MVSAPIDPTVIAELDELSDDESFFDQMLAVFLRDLGPSLDALGAARDSQDVEGLFKLAHRLKSAAANIGARSLTDSCLAVERPARQGELGASVEQLEGLFSAANDVLAWAQERRPSVYSQCAA